MCIKVFPSFISGEITVPPSKSYMQRALLASLLSDGPSQISNPGYSNDDQDMMKSITRMGAEIKNAENSVIIRGGLDLKENKINVGESGLGIRLLAPVAALFEKTIVLSGEGSLLNRPMETIKKALNDLGAFCETKNGYLPVEVQGPLIGGEIELDGSLSSQFLSGLLFALPLAKSDSKIHVSNLKSTPYIDLTLDILKKHGIFIENINYQTFIIKGNQKYKPADHYLEGDWSSGAFLMVAAAINGNLEIKGLKQDSLQADRKILEALDASGATIDSYSSFYKIKKTEQLTAFNFDATDAPDLFPPLACLASNCEGTSAIKGANRLVHKESNRAQSLIQEFSNMGIDIWTTDSDTMMIKGGKAKGGIFDSHNDHRIAMAGAVTALKAENPILIKQHQSVQKSYPGFFEDLKKLNVKMEKNS